MDNTSKKAYFLRLNLSKHRLCNMQVSDIEKTFDVCNKKTIDEYESAIKCVIKYNLAYEERLSLNRTKNWHLDNNLWNLRTEITNIRHKLKYSAKIINDIALIQLENRLNYIKKILIEKYK